MSAKKAPELHQKDFLDWLRDQPSDATVHDIASDSCAIARWLVDKHGADPAYVYVGPSTVKQWNSSQRRQHPGKYRLGWPAEVYQLPDWADKTARRLDSAQAPSVGIRLSPLTAAEAFKLVKAIKV